MSSNFAIFSIFKFLQNNLSELWSLLNFLLPDIFDDLENFQVLVFKRKAIFFNNRETILICIKSALFLKNLFCTPWTICFFGICFFSFFFFLFFFFFFVRYQRWFDFSEVGTESGQQEILEKVCTIFLDTCFILFFPLGRGKALNIFL